MSDYSRLKETPSREGCMVTESLLESAQGALMAGARGAMP